MRNNLIKNVYYGLCALFVALHTKVNVTWWKDGLSVNKRINITSHDSIS